MAKAVGSEPVGERTGNPLTGSATGGRLLSASQLPFFLLRPPRGYGVLTTVGRKSGKRRRRCVRALRDGNRVVIVAIKGRGTGWLSNLEANPRVSLRLRDGWFTGNARLLDDDPERVWAQQLYCNTTPGLFERPEYRMWRSERPSAERIRELHRSWAERGVPVVVELDDPA